MGRTSAGRRRRSRSRPRRPLKADRELSPELADEDLYQVELLTGKRADPFPVFNVPLPVDGDSVEPPQLLPHVCARPGVGYAIRVTNHSRRHVACAVTVDGENALLQDGSLIVAPFAQRELPGFLVSKNFVGREYVKEYRDFRFGKPKVVESDSARGARAPEASQAYTTFGIVRCDVYEAVLDEEVDSDQEMRGQTTNYRGAGLNGSKEEREVPEGKKTHLVYSSVTVQGPRSSIANSTSGRWWIRGQRKLRTLEIRYREAHSLMLLGVDPKELGLIPYCKDESDDERGDARSAVSRSSGEQKASHKKEDKKEEFEDKKEKFEEPDELKLPSANGLIEVCDLTCDSGEEGGAWSTCEAPPRAEPVDCR